MPAHLNLKAKLSISKRSLRDIIIISSAVSIYFFRTTQLMVATAIAVFIVGVSLHFLTKGELIRQRVLCTTGIYAIVRHPFYLSSYLIDTSFILISGNYYLLLVYPFLFGWAYGPEMRDEEHILFEIHKDNFLEYQKRTPSQFPDRTMLGVCSSILCTFSLSRITSGEVKRILRFCAVAVFLLFLRELRTDGTVELALWKNWADWDAKSLAVLFVLFGIAAILCRPEASIEKTPIESANKGEALDVDISRPSNSG